MEPVSWHINTVACNQIHYLDLSSFKILLVNLMWLWQEHWRMCFWKYLSIKHWLAKRKRFSLQGRNYKPSLVSADQAGQAISMIVVSSFNSISTMDRESNIVEIKDLFGYLRFFNLIGHEIKNRPIFEHIMIALLSLTSNKVFSLLLFPLACLVQELSQGLIHFVSFLK